MIQMYHLITSKQGTHQLVLCVANLRTIVAEFYDRKTGDLVCNLLNVVRCAPITSKMQAG
jgi:hypothetical protein